MSGLAILSERSFSDRGGLAVATARIARQAVGRGEAVHVVCWSDAAAPGARRVLDSDGVIVHHVGRLERPDDALMALTHHAHDVVQEHALSLVHGIYARYAGYAAVVAAAWAGIPSVVSLRGNDLDRGLFRAGDLPLLTAAVSRATAVTGVSQEISHRAAAVFGRAVRTVPNSVDTDLFRPEARDNTLRCALGLGDETVIGFLGELREKKGLRFLLPAFAEVARRRPARLLLLGGVRSDASAALDAFATAAPEAWARTRVIAYDRSPKRLRRLLCLCDVVVFPALYEGMPNAVLETMAVGRPVLVTDVGGHRDLVRHGVTGARLSLADLDRLPDAIEELLDLDPGARAALGQAARRFVAEHHRPELESQAYADVYAEARAAFTSAERAPGTPLAAPRDGAARSLPGESPELPDVPGDT
jgi:glycosyltransferase involved in cell wall biosynthesis